MSARQGKRHAVRPRWTWLGLALLILGVLVLGAGVIALSWPLSIAGVAVALIGTAAVIRGGLYYDTDPTASVSGIVDQVRSGDKHDAPGPDSLLGDEKLRHEVAVQSRQAELARTQDEAVPVQLDDRLAIGTGILLGIGAWLGLGSIWIYPTSGVGQNGSVRDTLVAVVVVCCGVRMKLGNTPSLVAPALAVLSGLILLAFGLLLAHSSLGAQVQEIACGVLILLGAALAARRP